MSPNFTACSAQFLDNLDLYKNYTYTGPVAGISLGAAPPLLTLQGCYDLCGTGPEYYTWTQASGTILTWIMPMLALLVKAPFGAGSLPKRTMLNTFRWVGSPIASLAYIFWNIKVTGKTALMADMASSYDEVPGQDTQYADVRDSLYILSTMNQYSIRSGLPDVEAEKLLRVALFSDTLKLSDTESETLPMKRQKLAYRLRAGRRQGLVPVFVSLVWWMFGLAVSLENAFGKIGANATAHNLAIGLMMAWFPVLILCSIVDRTPWATDEIRIRLNDLLDAVREALLDQGLRETYMRVEGRTPHDFQWVEVLRSQTFMGTSGFFTGFAGQGRVKFHYGVANPILTGIEEAYVARKGRGWLGGSKEEIWHARTALVLGPDHGENLEGLRYFDPREFWEILCAIIMVGGPIIGAFVISYFTPTVGYGCRSGGYSIFFIIAFSAALFEGLTWWRLPKSTPNALREKPDDKPGTRWTALARYLATLYKYDPRKLVEVTVLRPLEMINTTWLCYGICAQTFGSYNTCLCQASTWAGGGGYISFESSEFFKNHGILLYWVVGSTISLFFMVAGIAYVTAEWLTQSHLNTTNYAAAARGLRRTRTFKKYTLWLRIPVDVVLSLSRVLWETARGAKKGYRGRRSLVWAWREGNGINAPVIDGTPAFDEKSQYSYSGDEKRGEGGEGPSFWKDGVTPASIPAKSDGYFGPNQEGASNEKEQTFDREREEEENKDTQVRATIEEVRPSPATTPPEHTTHTRNSGSQATSVPPRTTSVRPQRASTRPQTNSVRTVSQLTSANTWSTAWTGEDDIPEQKDDDRMFWGTS